MSSNNKSLQTFLEEFYRDDLPKILETTHHIKTKPKKIFQDESDEEEETPVYLYRGHKVEVPTDLHILNFPMEVSLN